MKVKLLPKVSSYSQDGVNYKPGDIFELGDRRVRLDFMLPIVDAPVVAQTVKEPEPEPVEVVTQVSSEPEEPVPVKKTKKKTSATEE